MDGSDDVRTVHAVVLGALIISSITLELHADVAFVICEATSVW